ncbi:MAG: IS66 family insertion sequence element accessory protein TnpA [Saccharofermentanales bacterium]
MEKKYKADEGKTLVQAQISSGINGSEYCRRNKISYEILKYWRKRLGYTKKQNKNKTQNNTWIKLEIPETIKRKSTMNSISVKISDMTVEIPGGSLRKDIEQILDVVAKICWN